MPFCYDKLFEILKDPERNKGITSYTIRTDKIISEGTLTSLRNGHSVKTEMLCRLCYLLNCQPGDIMEYIPDAADMKQNRASE